MKPLYIFDLNGTLSLTAPRTHLRPKKGGDWIEWQNACALDAPNWPVVSVLAALLADGSEVRIWTDRTESMREITLRWLEKVELNESMVTLVMRPDDSVEHEDKLKERWLDELEPAELESLNAVFDDSERVTNMFRARGIVCFNASAYPIKKVFGRRGAAKDVEV